MKYFGFIQSRISYINRADLFVANLAGKCRATVEKRVKPLEFKYQLGMSYKGATNRMLVRRLMETVKMQLLT
jgi:hypothetical protein